MPNQPGVALCYGFEIHPEFRGKGYGHKLKESQMKTLSDMGVRFAICTIKTTNLAQRRILTKAGWVQASKPFISPGSGKATEVWQCHIN
jgi:predicted acetyltransferase